MTTLVHCCGAGCGVTAPVASAAVGAAPGAGFGGRRHWFRCTNPLAVAPSIVASIRYPGAMAYRWDTTGGAAVSYFGQDFATPPTVAVLRCAVLFTQLPSGDVDLLIVSAAAGTFPGLRFTSATSKLQGSFTTTLGGGVVVELNHWYVIDLKVDCSANPWTLNVQIDGVAMTPVTKAQAASTLVGYRQGLQTNAVTAKVDLSDFAASVTAADYPLGNGRVKAFYPTHDGTHVFNGPNPGPDATEDPAFAASDFQYNANPATPVPVNATDLWSYLDDVAGAGGDSLAQVVLNETSYIEVKGAGDAGPYAPRGLEVVTTHHSSTTSSNAQSVRLREGAWETAVVEDLDQSQGAALIYNSQQVARHPSGFPWTLAQFNNLAARWGYGAALSSTPELDALCVEAAFPLPPVPKQVGGVRGEGVILSDLTPQFVGPARVTPTVHADTVVLADYVLRARLDFPTVTDALLLADLQRALTILLAATESRTMAADPVEISNLALAHLGVSKRITALTDPTKEAKACTQFYYQARDEVLRMLPWPFATAFGLLPLVLTAPPETNGEWAYSYRLPTGALAMRRLLSGARNDSRASRIPFREGQDATGTLIYTDQDPTTAWAEWTATVTDVPRFAPDFVQALAFQLAAWIAPTVASVDGFKLRDVCFAMAQRLVARAGAAAMRDENLDIPPESDFILARS